MEQPKMEQPICLLQHLCLCHVVRPQARSCHSWLLEALICHH